MLGSLFVFSLGLSHKIDHVDELSLYRFIKVIIFWQQPDFEKAIISCR